MFKDHAKWQLIQETHNAHDILILECNIKSPKILKSIDKRVLSSKIYLKSLTIKGATVLNVLPITLLAL